jgi:Cu2+-containing amine oxidase
MWRSRRFLVFVIAFIVVIDVIVYCFVIRNDDGFSTTTQQGKDHSGVRQATVSGPTTPIIDDEIIQEFPMGGDQTTAWRVRFSVGRPRPGLRITGAWFKTNRDAHWFQVIGEIRLSEIFVPYNNGITRLYDIGAQGNYDLLEHTLNDAGLNGKLRHDNLVVQELRDRGVLWKHADKVCRGQELVLWATLGATNYNYILEFAFRCDATICCRLGSTGKNLSDHESMGHIHNGCWRIDLNVGDKDHNNVAVLRRSEEQPGVSSADTLVEYLKIEGGIPWKAEEFTRLRVESKIRNALGKPISYELLPQRIGTARHFAEGDEFTAYDFWVTPVKFDELYYCQVPHYAKQGRNVEDTDVVIWYMSSAYHLPRDEDGIFLNPRGLMQVRGVALTTWSGLEMQPHNLFDSSPFYPAVFSK